MIKVSLFIILFDALQVASYVQSLGEDALLKLSLRYMVGFLLESWEREASLNFPLAINN